MRRGMLLLLVIAVIVQSMAMPVFAASEDDGGLLSGLGDFIMSGLKKLFIPRDDYFPRLQDRLYDAFQSRFGGIVAMANYLKNRFTGLRAYNGDLFVLKFPRSHLFGGVHVDLLEGAGGIADMIRAALSGFVVICTAIFAHRKVTDMINT